ncbi:GPP34 family phosphoprotein [Roseomonas sp. M0104]|uniref:GPP34 family phosphoprotein n=1 Tax=Teichococcus coralli TaxID=2545983 RepID=A0A845B4B6_9PROT|nr:GPP34 family phosphoprotein [Pseudoroseomonas coralli]MXP62021.1 GPP34 family phosphoprotein [Pseudoroseomonas coralli]
MSLTMPEELLLLMLDDESGRLFDRAAPSGDYALAASVLAELLLEDRIHTDPEHLAVTSPAPTGDAALDGVLARIRAETTAHGTRWWIETLGSEAEGLRDHYFDRLVERGVLKLEEGRFLWIFPERRYPQISDKEEREVKGRLMAVIFDDHMPSPRDALLIGLVRAAGLFPLLLASHELDSVQPRIDALAEQQELSRTLTDAVRDIFTDLARVGPVI